MENENGTLKQDYIYMCLKYSSKSLWNLKTDKNVAINCPSDILTYLFGIKFYGAETNKIVLDQTWLLPKIWYLVFQLPNIFFELSTHIIQYFIAVSESKGK